MQKGELRLREALGLPKAVSAGLSLAESVGSHTALPGARTRVPRAA